MPLWASAMWCPIVPPGQSYRTDVTLKIYPGMGHSASEDELADVLGFLRRVVPNLPPAQL